MAILLMFRATLDYLTTIRYILAGGCYKLVNAGTPSIITSAGNAQLLAYHIRFSHTFYNSGLIHISGFDATAGTTAVVYNFMLGTGLHLNVITLCDNTTAPVSIEDAFHNATWYERETSEMLGLSFVGSRDGRALLLPYNSSSNPMKKIMPTNSTSSLGYCRCVESLSWFQL